MHLNLLSDKDKELLLFTAAGNGDVCAQKELERRYRIYIWCNGPKVPSTSEDREVA
jgi:hypothetical protein